MTKFAGHLMAIEKKSDVDNNDEDVIVECTELTEDGLVELAWDDRNERCYIKFNVADLMRAMCQAGVPSKS